jgi:hypothetical protein
MEHTEDAGANSEGTTLFACKVIQSLEILSVDDFSEICWIDK